METVKDRIQSCRPNEVLDLSNLELYEFPEIPWYITRVNLSNNFINEIIEIPKTIKTLDVSKNKLSKINFLEKSKLVQLNLSQNCLENLDLTNTKNLCSLDVSYNQIDKIKGLNELSNLTSLNIAYNIFTEIELPESVYVFLCNNNLLNSIKNLPETIEHLNCSNNNLRFLPKIPAKIQKLIISRNPIDKIEISSSLSKLTVFDCKDTNLENLPDLPSKIQFLNCDNTDIRIIKVKNTLKIKGNSIERNPIYFDFLGSCYDVMKDRELPVQEFMLSEDSILIKLFDDLFGVKRSYLQNLGNNRNHIFKDDSGKIYINAFLGKFIEFTDFENFLDLSCDVYQLSRSQDYRDFIGETVEERIYSEIIHIQGYSLSEYVENHF